MKLVKWQICYFSSSHRSWATFPISLCLQPNSNHSRISPSARWSVECLNHTLIAIRVADSTKSLVMSAEPKIICFQHCDPHTRVFTFSLPDYCPICTLPLASANLPIPPFEIPYPFSKANSCPSSIIIKPTEGDFLQ